MRMRENETQLHHCDSGKMRRKCNIALSQMLASNPRDVDALCGYACFLSTVKDDYAGAAELYRRAPLLPRTLPSATFSRFLSPLLFSSSPPLLLSSSPPAPNDLALQVTVGNNFTQHCCQGGPRARPSDYRTALG